MKRAILVGVVVLALVVAGALRWSSARPAEVAQAPTAPAPAISAGVAPAAAASEPPCRFSTGNLLAYDVTSTTRVSTTSAPETVNQSTARITFEVLRVDAASAVLLARATALTGAFDQTAAGADQPWLLRVNERCEVDGFAHQKGALRRVARLQQGLAHELWFSLPKQQGPVLVAFDNAVGRAFATIAPTGGAGSHHYVRTIQHYETTWAPAMNGVIVARSHTEVRRGNGGWFEFLEGTEELSVPGLVDKATASLRVVSAAPDGAVVAQAPRDEAHYVWGNTFEEVPSQELRPYVAPDHQQRVEAMRNVAYPDALKGMLQTFGRTSNLYEQTRDMAAFLDAHPDQIHEFAGAVLTEFEPEWKAAGFLALSSTQNAAAREVLLDVWRERDASEMDRIRASVGLVTRRDVGAPLAKELLAESRRPGTQAQRSVSQHALIHAGMLSGLRQEDEEVRTTVQVGLASELPARQTIEERAPLFSAIGNTGDLAFLPELERASRHPDPEWRAIVPIGMRRMPVAAVRDFTLEWLRRETSPLVMRELFEVVQHQYQDVGKVVDDELKREAVQYLRRQPRILTRQSLLQLLAPFVATDEEVRAALRAQLKVEYETDSGMFPFIAMYLPQEDITMVLATIPSLADQHRGEAPVRLPVMAPPPPPSQITPDMVPRVDVPDQVLQ
jgi:hypothetical protein